MRAVFFCLRFVFSVGAGIEISIATAQLVGYGKVDAGWSLDSLVFLSIATGLVVFLAITKITDWLVAFFPKQIRNSDVEIVNGGYGITDDEPVRVSVSNKQSPSSWDEDLPNFLPISRVDEIVERTLAKEPIEDR